MKDNQNATTVDKKDISQETAHKDKAIRRNQLSAISAMKMVILPGIAQIKVNIKAIQTEYQWPWKESDSLTKSVIFIQIFRKLKNKYFSKIF